jgi:hypothetical protein
LLRLAIRNLICRIGGGANVGVGVFQKIMEIRPRTLAVLAALCVAFSTVLAVQLTQLQRNSEDCWATLSKFDVGPWMDESAVNDMQAQYGIGVAYLGAAEIAQKPADAAMYSRIAAAYFDNSFNRFRELSDTDYRFGKKLCCVRAMSPSDVVDFSKAVSARFADAMPYLRGLATAKMDEYNKVSADCKRKSSANGVIQIVIVLLNLASIFLIGWKEYRT